MAYYVSSGQVSSGIILNVDSMFVYSSGTASETTVDFNGRLFVSSGGTADLTTVNSSGYLLISSGGTATQTTVNSKGKLHVSYGGIVYDTTVNFGGGVSCSNAVANNTTVNSGGSLVVSSGGTAAGISAASGAVLELTVAPNTYFNGSSGGYSFTMGNAFISGYSVDSTGRLNIASGGTAEYTTVKSGGSLVLSSGGTAAGISASAGAVLELTVGLNTYFNGTSGGSAFTMDNAYISGYTVNSGARLNITDESTADHTTVNASGLVHVFSGGTAVGTTVNSDGRVYVSFGGMVADTTVNADGNLYFYGNGKATGRLQIGSGAVVYAYAGGIIDFDISAFNGSSTARVNDLSLIQGTPDYSITINRNQAEGVYMLAGGASAFTGTVSIGTDGKNYGNLTVNGDSLTVGDYTYTLATSSDDLQLTITESSEPEYVDLGVITSFCVLEGASIAFPEEIDRYIFTIVNPAFVTIETSGIAGGDTVLWLLDEEQTEIAYNDDKSATDYYSLIGTNLAAGTYMAEVSAYGTSTISNYSLAVTVSGPGPVAGGIAGDLNADGRADIVMTIDQGGHPADGSTGAWLIQENQTAAWGDLSTRNSGWEIFGTGRTAEGKAAADVYIRSTDNVIGAWITDADGKVTGWETIGEFSSDTQIVGLGDFNGNGQTDLLLRNTNGAVGCYFTGGETTGWNYFQSLGDEWKLSAVGDLNGDGRDDVVLKHDAGFAGSWLTQADGTMAWADLDTLPEGFEIVGAGDFNGDGIDDVLLKSGNYYGAWLVNDGNAAGWMGLGDLGDVTVEQIADFNGDGIDDLRIRTAAGDLGTQLVIGEDNLSWQYYGSVGAEWNTSQAALA